MDPELLKLANQYGVDPSMLAGLGSGSVSDSPSVFMGESRTYRADGDTPRAIGGKVVGGGSTTKTLEQANSEFYRLSQSELIALQRKFIAAGLLDSSKVRLGDYDDETYGIFAAINERAAKFYAVGKKVTPNDVLGMISRTGGPKAEEPKLSAVERARLGFQTDTHIYTPSDPASMRRLTEEAFKAAIGRKPKKDVLEKFVNAFLSMEREGQAAGFAVADKFAGEDRARALQLAGVEDSMAAGVARDGGGTAGGAAIHGPMIDGRDGAPATSESAVLWERLQRMIADAPGKITPGKRSRSYEEQVRLWNNYKAGKGPQAAKPGTSKHGDGRANDLQYENDAVRQWALENAHKYGLAFPIYNPKLSRKMDESWHVEVAKGTFKGGGGGGHAGHSHGAAGVGTAPISRSATVGQVDLQARALEAARNENPSETRAFEIGGQFENLLAIISRGVGV